MPILLGISIDIDFQIFLYYRENTWLLSDTELHWKNTNRQNGKSSKFYKRFLTIYPSKVSLAIYTYFIHLTISILDHLYLWRFFTFDNFCQKIVLMIDTKILGKILLILILGIELIFFWRLTKANGYFWRFGYVRTWLYGILDKLYGIIYECDLIRPSFFRLRFFSAKLIRPNFFSAKVFFGQVFFGQTNSAKFGRIYPKKLRKKIILIIDFFGQIWPN